jgi:hypothetical protein
MRTNICITTKNKNYANNLVMRSVKNKWNK